MSTGAADGAVDTNHDLIEKWETFFNRYYHGENSKVAELALGYPRHRDSIRIEFADLPQFDHELAQDWLEHPEHVEEYAQEALDRIALPFQPDEPLSGARVRVGGLDDAHIYDVNSLLDDDVGSYVGIKGQVSRIQQQKPRVKKAAWECARCGTANYTQGKAEPHECEGCKRKGPFHYKSEKSEKVAQQWIRLQLPPEKTEGVDASIDIRLVGRDLIQKNIRPGDRVVVNCVLEARVENLNNDDPIEEELIGKGVAVDIQESSFEDIEIEPEDVEKIEEIAENDPFEQITHSIAPHIQGHQREKEAIALQMFGGVPKETASGDPIRENFHVAFIGDPGTGKSELIQHADRVAPRSVYTGGNDTTGAGLTSTAENDDFGDGGWTIKGGAIVQADGGLCCIDELDDMDEEEQKSLNEPLETQKVHASKAGNTAVLPARTSVLITANPTYGRFDPFQPIGEQIDLPSPLFSRFDLIFTFTDKPDKQRDAEILNAKADTAQAAQQRARNEAVDVDDPSEPDIDEDLLRKYIAYCRQEYTPVLTDDSKQEISRIMNDLRQASGDGEDSPIPVTFRKMDAFIRLSEASAKGRQSDYIENQDVERVRDLIVNCMQDVGVDPETGEFDADVVETGTSKSQRDRINTLRSVIEDQETEHDHGLPIEELYDILPDENDRIDHEIDQLKQKGEIYEPQTDHVMTT